MTLHDRLARILSRVDALTLRERLFVFAAVLVVMGGAWEALLATPLDLREALAASRIDDARKRLGELDASLDAASLGIGDGMSGQFGRLDVLRQQVARGDEAIRVFTSDLVDPAQMRYVLEDLLRGRARLELVSISNLPVEPIVATEADAPAGGGSALFRHGMVVVLEGSYLDCLAYLQSVERLPWQLYWSSLELDASTYPRSRITIELHTLSLAEEWIGV
jgi:MSHA biogenesis protein MshJ